MGKALQVIGAIVVSLLMYCIPVITTIAMLHHWDSFWQWLLVIMSICKLALVFELIYYFTESEDE